MVDKRTFLSWVIQQLASSNLGQAPFVAFIAEGYLDDIVSSRPFAYHLAVAIVQRLVEVGQLPHMSAQLLMFTQAQESGNGGAGVFPSVPHQSCASEPQPFSL